MQIKATSLEQIKTKEIFRRIISCSSPGVDPLRGSIPPLSVQKGPPPYWRGKTGKNFLITILEEWIRLSPPDSEIF